MPKDLDRFFDRLRSEYEMIRTLAGHEAMIHDCIVRPLFTDPAALGWRNTEVFE